MAQEDPKDRLFQLLRERAVLRGDFALSSGQRSRYYLDARLVTLSAEGSGLVGRVFLDELGGTGVEAVAGLAIGADPIVSSIATVAGQLGKQVDGLIVRKEAKSHGTGRRIEGPWRPGIRVAIVDDTLTTGASSLEAARALEEAGNIVLGVWALIDRDQGARGAVESAGLRFHAFFQAAELLAT